MTLRVSVIGQVRLDSRADGIAAYLRSFFKYADGLECVYWGGEDFESYRFGKNTIVCKPIGFAGPKIFPRRFATMLAIWRHRHKILTDTDVLFVHNSEWILPFVFCARRPPIVLVRHGWNPPEIRKTRGLARYVWLLIADYLAVNIASRTILVSRQSHDAFRRSYPALADRLEYIPTFVDDEMLLTAPTRNEARRILNCHESDLILLVVARLVPEKQIDKAIRILSLVRREESKAKLLIVGNGPEEQRLRALVKELSLDDAVSFVGAVPHERINVYFSAADFLLLVSQWEGTSIALLEGLSFQIPVIVSDVADHRSLILDGVNGRVLNPAKIIEEGAEWVLRIRKHQMPVFIAERNFDRTYLASTVVPKIVEQLRQAAHQDRNTRVS